MPSTATDPVIASCSFCAKRNTDVASLVAGPGVFICNECVDLCTQVMAGKPAKEGPDLAPWDQVTDADAIVANLPRIAAAGAQVERNLTQWVRKARALGVTWARIGESLGMTRQSAWERFSGEE